ncbi:hypothetical protein ACLOJK_016399 [Asimina triloba]
MAERSMSTGMRGFGRILAKPRKEGGRPRLLIDWYGRKTGPFAICSDTSAEAEGCVRVWGGIRVACGAQLLARLALPRS